MARTLERSVLFAVLCVVALATGLSGCSPGPMIDRLPSDMGLPSGAPARPAAPYRYPAVHDMPPVRSDRTMTDEEQVRMERELKAVRDRQAGKAAADTAPAKKKPAEGPKAGAKTNP